MQKDFTNGKVLKLESRLELVDVVREDFGVFLRDCGLSEKDVNLWKLVLSEAVVNAIVHGNHSDASKQVTVGWHAGGNEIVLEITDEGSGPEGGMQETYDLPVDPLDTHGRGLYLITQFCDRWEHWKSHYGYRQVLIKTHSKLFTAQSSDLVLEQALSELSACYESLSAFYRLGDGLVRSENVADFVVQALDDLEKVVKSDCIKFSLSDTLQRSLLDAFIDVNNVSITVDEEGTESDVFLSRDEYVWENFDEIENDPMWKDFGSGFCGLAQAAGNVVGVIILARESNIPYFNSAELNTIRTFADLIGIAVINANNAIVREREHKAFRELEIASEMQDNLLPMPTVEPHERWDVFARRKSVREVAGDYIEVCFSQNDDLYLVIVDVMGKGVPAAFLAAMFRTALSISMNHTYSLDELIAALNQVLCEQTGDLTMFVTCGIARISKALDQVEFVNAGHCPILFLTGEKELISIEPSGPPLGIFTESTFKSQTYPLKGEEQVYMITDGLYEWEQNGTIWGWSAFIDFVKNNHKKTPAHFWSLLQKRILAAQDEESETEDDQTFLYWELK